CLRGSMWPGRRAPASGIVLPQDPQDHAALAGHARPRRRYLLGGVDRAAALALSQRVALNSHERGVAAVALATADTGELRLGDANRLAHGRLRGVGSVLHYIIATP